MNKIAQICINTLQPGKRKRKWQKQKLISKLSTAVKVKALSVQGFLRYWDCDYLVSGGKADQDKTLTVSWKVKHDFLSD